MPQIPGASWVSWSELPWVQSRDAAAGAIQLCHRVLDASVEAAVRTEFLRDVVTDIATEFSAQYAAVMQRTPKWKVVADFGRHSLTDMPHAFFEESLDRDAGGFLGGESLSGWKVLSVPLANQALGESVLVLIGRQVTEDSLPFALSVGRALDVGLRFARSHEDEQRRIERLKSTLQITSSFARERKSGRLLEVIAREATRLLGCDRASIFVWDRDRHELVACPALGMTDGSLRVPDDAGVVGQVISSGEAVRVDDAYQDERFNQEVDRSTGYQTRNLICVPVRNDEGKLIGAFECLNKLEGRFTAEDEDSLEQLGIHAATAIRNTAEWEQLIRSRKQLTEQVTQGVRIVGESPAIVALRSTVERLASTDLPVLILGESGTGKEVVAQSLHYLGARAECPFIAVNCAALTESLLEDELFGHEKGAFTDARDTRQGKFELAEGGTLFLDEIGDMSPGGQAKLLRVLEEKVITRVGGSKTIPIDVRVVAATNVNLTEKVREKKFREDLYYRLSVVTQQLPPLRDRPEDILPLAEHFLRQFCSQARRHSLILSAEARRHLQAHSWPGNVRELRNLMERVAFLTQGEKVEVADLAFILSPDRESRLEPSPDLGLTEATKQFQQEFIRQSIKRVNGNMSEAARLLGLHRSNLYRKMRQLDMDEFE